MIDEPEATGDARDEHHSTMALTKHRLPGCGEEQEGTDEIGVDDLSEGFRLQSMRWSQCDGPNGMHHTLEPIPCGFLDHRLDRRFIGGVTLMDRDGKVTKCFQSVGWPCEDMDVRPILHERSHDPGSDVPSTARHEICGLVHGCSSLDADLNTRPSPRQGSIRYGGLALACSRT